MEKMRAPFRNVYFQILKSRKSFPNNEKLPVVWYRDLEMIINASVSSLQNILKENNWNSSWIDSIYDYHHYHSTAHEVLIIKHGTAEVQLGGEEGETFFIGQGDVLVLPAGVSHKKIKSSEDFLVVGAYPEGTDWDMCYGKTEELEKARENILKVPLPQLDPIWGKKGPLLKLWS